MKLNEDKCHLLVGGYKQESIWAKTGDARSWESNKQKLLEVHIDRTLSLDEHVSNLCKKAGRKLSVLPRLSSYMTLTQRRVLIKFFVGAHFGYCLLVWMFHCRVLNKKINHSLRIVYKDNISSFHELLQKDYSFTIHHKSIHILAVELYKTKKKSFSSIFPPRLIKYNLRIQSDFFKKLCK